MYLQKPINQYTRMTWGVNTVVLGKYGFAENRAFTGAYFGKVAGNSTSYIYNSAITGSSNFDFTNGGETTKENDYRVGSITAWN